MEYKILYVLTVRCTEDNCEADLECHKILDVDENNFFIENRKIPKKSMMEIEHIRYEKEDMILRVPFLIKESAIIWLREIFVDIQKKKGAEALYEAAREEWLRIMPPKYDTKWFTGGKKVVKWREEMKSLIEKL